ncbi:MAG: segregation/condensation protein A [Hyphomonadaceae bacterium]|nr:MAG: segregation and condensation protein A [Caulobacteraceae bacterium]MBT9445488.1 segregation/condensation protein A [Hyphomonadaceae bacterium]TPW07036.1 MAG: segregation and condensation protein A [Alphaproteobacteria bacterium]
MSEDAVTFEAAEEADAGETLVLDLDGFEGPLHVLLDLARHQKVDLAQIALAPLVDQYLAFIEDVRTRIDLAAEYLVMAAWLTLLKSRLLLPKPERPVDEPDPEAIAAHLSLKLQRLAEAKAAAAKLGALAQLDRDVFLNWAPQPIAVTRELKWTASLHDMLSAYTAGRTRRIRIDHRIEPRRVYTLEAARHRLEEMLEGLDDWRPIGALQPRRERGPEAPEPQSYVASLFGASLELVRDQKLEARQADQYAPLYLRRRRPHEGDAS